MAARASANRLRLPILQSLFSRVPNLRFQFNNNRYLGQSIRTLAQSVSRETESSKGNTRIYGAPKRQPLRHREAEWPRILPTGYDRSVSRVHERRCTPSYRLFENAKATGFSPKPKPKPDIFVCHKDEDNCEYFTAYSREEDGTISRIYDIYPPAHVVEDFYFFTGSSCHGLFSFQNMQNDHLLWNPTTNEFKMLPKCFVELPRVAYHTIAVEMWFDQRSEDYKVLSLVLGDTEDEEGECIDLSYHIGLYSLKTNSWKKIPCGELGYSGCSVRVNGFFYCPSRKEDTRVILSFDFSTATLSSLPLPNIAKSDFYDVIEYKGLLGILAYSGVGIERNYELWVMNDGSWTRESVFHTYGVRRQVWFSEDGELLYFESFNDELLLFDRAIGKLKHLGIYCFSGSLEFFPFFESFVQLNGLSSDAEEKEKEKEKEKEEDGYVIELTDGPLMLV